MGKVKTDFGDEVSGHFRSLLTADEDSTDVMFVFATHTVRLHSEVLAFHSPFLERLVETPNDEQAIIIYEAEFCILKALVEFLYLGETDIEESKLADLNNAAYNLGIVRLRSAILNYDYNDDQFDNDVPPGEETIAPIDEALAHEEEEHENEPSLDALFEEISAEELECYMQDAVVVFYDDMFNDFEENWGLIRSRGV